VPDWPKQRIRQPRDLVLRRLLPRRQVTVILPLWLGAISSSTTTHRQIDRTPGNELRQHLSNERLRIDAKLWSSDGINREINQEPGVEDRDQMPVPNIIRRICRSLPLEAEKNWSLRVSKGRDLDRHWQGLRPNPTLATDIHGNAREQNAVIDSAHPARDPRAVGHEQFSRHASRILDAHEARLAPTHR
jgi:hypothetical protein